MGRGRLWLLLAVGDGTWGLALLLWPFRADPVSGKENNAGRKA